MAIYTGGRCECTTRSADVPGHDPSLMLDPQYQRRPRDLKEHEAALAKSESAPTVRAAQQATAPLGLVPLRTALSLLPMVHVYGHVAFDSLHVLDGGVTMRHLIIFGNWLLSVHGSGGLDLVNRRLRALPRHDDFTHFERPLFCEDNGAAKRTRLVKMTTNWRCVEYEQLMSQMMYVQQLCMPAAMITAALYMPIANAYPALLRYLAPEYEAATRILMAWANLYISLRNVAPTEEDISRTWLECSRPKNAYCGRLYISMPAAMTYRLSRAGM